MHPYRVFLICVAVLWIKQNLEGRLVGGAGKMKWKERERRVDTKSDQSGRHVKIGEKTKTWQELINNSLKEL